MSSTVLSQHSHTESKSRLFWQGNRRHAAAERGCFALGAAGWLIRD